MSPVTAPDAKARSQRFLAPLASLVAFIVLNLIGDALARASGTNFHLDTIGTSVAALTGGFFPAIVCGYLSNLIISLFDESALYFAAINVLVGGGVAFFAQRGSFKTPLKTTVAILTIALLTTCVTALISWFLYGMADLSTGDSMQDFLSRGFSTLSSQFLATLRVNGLDKVVTILIALLITRFLPEDFSERCHMGFWQQTPLGKEQREAVQYLDTRVASLRAKIFSIVAAVLVTVVAVNTYVSFTTYNNSMTTEETVLANGILDYLQGEINTEMVDTYLRKGYDAPGYFAIESKISSVEESFPSVAFIYVYTMEEDGCHVVFDPDTVEWEGDEPGTIVAYDDAMLPHLDDLLAGKQVDPVMTRDEYGWLLTFYRPIYNRRGRCVCYVCIDISMDHVVNGGYRFVTRVLALFGAFFILVCVLVLWLAEYAVLIPLNSITYVMGHFVSEADNLGRQENVRLLDDLKIHTGDEVELLYQAVDMTARDMVDYIDMTEKQNETISSMQENLIMVMADLVESRDKYTGDHVRKTARYCEIIMDELIREGIYTDQLTEEFVSNVSHSAPLHDIGKIHVPDAILNKPGRLTAEEFEIMKSHTTAGYEILEQAVKAVSEPTYLDEAKNLAEYHHEKWAGGGYPTGISGEDIPLSARIMAVADVFDALVSKRSYKDGFPLAKAYAIIEEGAGTHFDPQIARAFLNARDKAEEVCRAYGDGQTDKIRAKARKDSSSRKETPPSPGNKKERT